MIRSQPTAWAGMATEGGKPAAKRGGAPPASEGVAPGKRLGRDGRFWLGLLLLKVVARRWGERAGRWALIFLIAFPGALFFQFIYSESLFLLLVVGLWWGLERRRHGWAAVCAGLLPLCRGVGVFVLVLYSMPVLWRLDKGLLVWTWWLGVIPAMSGTFTSYVRFASCAFPVFLALGIGLSRREWRWVRWGLLGVFGVLHGVLLWRYVNFRWAG